MPEISRFFGIIILDGDVLDGSLPRRQLAQVREWIDQYRHELVDNWDRVTTKRVLLPVEPLR